jgi:hypothetical protein
MDREDAENDPLRPAYGQDAFHHPGFGAAWDDEDASPSTFVRK